jgi:hypothetical protein
MLKENVAEARSDVSTRETNHGYALVNSSILASIAFSRCHEGSIEW